MAMKMKSFLIGVLLAVMCAPAWSAQALRQSTATQIDIGPMVDATDGITPETSLTVTNFDCGIIKHADSSMAETSITITASGGSNDMAHLANGMYSLELSATDTGTLGRLSVWCEDSANTVGAFQRYMVLPSQVWDSLYGADKLQVDVVELSSDATAADNSEAFFDGTGYAGTNNIIPTVTSVTNLKGVDAHNVTGYFEGGTTPSQAGITDIDSSGTTTDELILASAGVDTDNNLIGYTLTLRISGQDPQTCIIDDAAAASDTVSCAGNWKSAPTAGGGDTYDIRNVFGEQVVQLTQGSTLDVDANGRVRVVEGTGVGELNLSGGNIGISAAGAQTILAEDCSSFTVGGTLGAACNDLENGGRLDLLIDSILEDTGTGRTWPLEPGVIYAVGPKDRHPVKGLVKGRRKWRAGERNSHHRSSLPITKIVQLSLASRESAITRRNYST